MWPQEGHKSEGMGQGTGRAGEGRPQKEGLRQRAWWVCVVRASGGKGKREAGAGNIGPVVKLLGAKPDCYS